MKKEKILWLTVAAVAATVAGVLCINCKKENIEKPPKAAPQLDIDNPGEQSEFPTSATEAEGISDTVL